MSFLVIALDGPSGVGKSTVARLLAQRLDCLYVDTGAMFRCLAWRWQQLGLSEGESELRQMGENTHIKMEAEHIWCNRTEVTEQIRSETVSTLSSKISRFPVIRDIMKQQQRILVYKVRQSGSHAGAVLEGRDIGTVVFPDADHKFFLVADIHERGKRRKKEMEVKGEVVSLEELTAEMLERDRKDSTRKHSPLKKAEDAVEIDTTGISVEEQVNRIVEIVNKTIK